MNLKLGKLLYLFRTLTKETHGRGDERKTAKAIHETKRSAFKTAATGKARRYSP